MEQFTQPEFSVTALTAALNNVPYTPQQITDSGLFESDGVSTTIIKVEERNGGLAIVEPTPRGGPGVTVDGEDRKVVPFEIDHFEINDAVLADEVQGVRAFGTDNELETLQVEVERKLARHARDLDATLEHQRVGAIKGLVVSGKGRTLHDLYARFEIAVPAAIALGINAQVTDLAGKLKAQVVYPIEDALDAAYTGFDVWGSRDFHDAMWAQDEVRETFLADREGYRLRDGAPDVFKFGMLTFRRYRTGVKATAANGGTAFIEAGTARVVPTGVPDLFITRFGPGDLEETVNTIGLPRYANQYPMQNGKGQHLDSQMNAISLCTRPAVLRKLTIQ